MIQIFVASRRRRILRPPRWARNSRPAGQRGEHTPLPASRKRLTAPDPRAGPPPEPGKILFLLGAKICASPARIPVPTGIELCAHRGPFGFSGLLGAGTHCKRAGLRFFGSYADDPLELILFGADGAMGDFVACNYAQLPCVEPGSWDLTKTVALVSTSQCTTQVCGRDKRGSWSWTSTDIINGCPGRINTRRDGRENRWIAGTTLGVEGVKECSC